MKHLLLALIFVLPVTLISAGSEPAARAKLKKFTKSSSVNQAQSDADPPAFLITDPAGPFTFRKVNKIRKLTNISITLTLEDGDTGPGDSDENQLTLALDGINTGILLNGFDSGQTDTLTLSGAPLNEAAIRSALKADGRLAATIFKADADNNGIIGSSASITTLVIQGKQKKR
jgi:hypothetical protein